MSDKKEYLSLLSRGFEKIPEGFHETDRWTIPQARIEYEGKNTIIVNFKEIVNYIKRDEKHFLKYIVKEIGTAGEIKKGHKVVKLKGKQKIRAINRLIKNYCENFVICETCGKPDTIIKKEGRVHLLICHACGTHRRIAY